MGYQIIVPDRLSPVPDRPCETRDIGRSAELDQIGIRLYRVEPGESIPRSGLHYHDVQEEAFYVLSGMLTFETPEQLYRVNSGECFVVEPGSPQRAFNDAESTEDARVLGMGAPPIDDAHTVQQEK